MAAISAKNIALKFIDKKGELFSDVSFSLEKERIAVITGLSGSGKTSFALCLARVIPKLVDGIFSGEVVTDGRVGMVFQDADTQVFLPTVEDELAFAPENLCLSKAETKIRVDEVIEELGIGHLRNKNPARLSGGQKQLVALGGVLTLNPDILIMDETLSQLDKEAKSRVKSLLKKLKSMGKAIILIEHDEDNYSIADEIWNLSGGKLRLISGYIPEVGHNG